MRTNKDKDFIFYSKLRYQLSNIKIYKASAGTGKTFNLVKEYLKIALKNPGEFGKILCITFTNKAAEEMKSRIIEDLHNLSTGSPNADGIRDAIESESKIEDITGKAELLLNNILHNYSYFAVSTIDKFFVNILKSFARELNLKLGFELELDQNKVLSEIIPDTLKDLSETDFVTEMLVEFTKSKVEEGSSWDFIEKLTNTAKLVFKDDYHNFYKNDISEEKIRKFFDYLKKFKKNFEEHIQSLAKDAYNELESFGLTLNDFAGKSRTSLMKYLLNIKSTVDGLNNVRSLSKYSEDVSTWVGKKETPSDEMVNAFNGVTGTNVNKILDFYETNIREYNTASLILVNFNLFVILKKVTETLKEYRDTNNVVLISDVYRLIKPLIESNDAPFIYEKSGNRYKYFLIDEAQDTSELQWFNLMPLLINSIAEGGSVIIVGDVKQSIYKFRNAFPEQFINIDKHFSDVTNIPLEESRRSLQEIVDFNNNLFDALKSHLDSLGSDDLKEEVISKDDIEILKGAYENHEHKTLKGNSGGYIKLKFFTKQEIIGDETLKDKIKEELHSDINRILETGYAQNNILILVEKNNHIAEFSSFLKDKGFNVISPSSRSLVASEEVRFLISMMRYLNDNSDKISLTEVLNFICRRKGVDVFELLEGKTPAELASELLLPELKDSYGYLSSLPVYELIERLLHQKKLKISFDNYTIKFLDTVFSFSVDNENDLESFLNWWDENGTRITISESSGTDSIEIMTIHSCKGLEREVVMIPYTDWNLKFDSNKDDVWLNSDKEPYNEFGKLPVKPHHILRESYFTKAATKESAMQLLDRINLAYVAFTRPKHALFLYADLPDNALNKERDRIIPPALPSKGKDLLKILVTRKENYAVDNNFMFESGELKNYKKKESQDETGTTKKFEPDELPPVDWQKKLRIKTFYDSTADTKDDRRLYGNIMHELLSMIYSENDIDTSLAFIFDSGKISKEQVEIFRKELKEIFSIPEIDIVFPPEAKVLSEKEIITGNGEMLRPDRVLEFGGKIFVIDFKTGAEHESYIKQINNYAERLSEIYSVKDITKVILYTSLKKVEVIK